MAKVAVLGGGMGGLETAFELVERGFEVEVFERGTVFGGKARSMGRFGTGTEGRRDLPGEHGFRFFPGFYKHVPDSMSRIPGAGGTGTVFDDLTPTTEVTIAQEGRGFVHVPARFPQNSAEWLALLRDFHDREALGIPSAEIDFFIRRLTDIATACQGRLMTQYEMTAWWDFIGAATRSTQYQKILAIGLTRSLVAMRAEQSSTRTVGGMLLQILIYVIRPGSATDRVLNAPTSDVWIEPWVAYLKSRGVAMHTGAETQALTFDGTRITSATVQMSDGSISTVEADYFVAAMPLERFLPLVTPAMTQKAPSFGQLHQLGVEWMNGIVFYLNRNIPIANGHIILVDSTWAITCISQPQFWTGVALSDFGAGTLKGLLSVDISDWKTAGIKTTTKLAEDCTAIEIATEVWAQLKASLPELSDADLLCPIDDAHQRSWFLDPDIDTRAAETTPAGAPTTSGLRGLKGAGTFSASDATDHDAEPLLINTQGSWYHRPDAATGIPNLFLAADYVRTYTDLATMEGANEAGRRAVNALLIEAKSSATPCQVWPLEQMGLFAPFRWVDSVCYALHLPQIKWGFLWKFVAGLARLGIAMLRKVGLHVGLLILLMAHPAFADGWRIPAQGTKALGTSNAGRLVLDDGSVVWYNPAAMTTLDEKWTITIGAPIVTYQLGYQDLGSRSLLGQAIAGPLTADGGRTAPVPHLYVVRRFNDRVSAGFGFNAPFGLGTNYGETYAGRYHATETSLTVFNLNPAVAVKVRPNLSLGLGLDVQASRATLASMIDFGSIGAAMGLGLAPQGQDGRLAFTGSAVAVGYDLSLLWEAADTTRVGVTYRSKVTHTLTGTADFTVPTAAAPLTGGGAVFTDTGATTTLPMPHDLSISVAHELNDRWTLVGDVSWSGWSAFRTLGVAFDNPLQPAISQNHAWRNTMRGAFGGEYHASDRWTWRAGGAYEMGPIPDATRGPRLPEENHLWLSAGGTRRLSSTTSIDFSYSNLRTRTAPLAIADPNAGTLRSEVSWRLNVFGISWNKTF